MSAGPGHPSAKHPCNAYDDLGPADLLTSPVPVPSARRRASCQWLPFSSLYDVLSRPGVRSPKNKTSASESMESYDAGYIESSPRRMVQSFVKEIRKPFELPAIHTSMHVLVTCSAEAGSENSGRNEEIDYVDSKPPNSGGLPGNSASGSRATSDLSISRIGPRRCALVFIAGCSPGRPDS